MSNKLRLYSGIILLVYVCGHLINHALGIISVDAMNAGLRVFGPFWHTLPGTVLLCGSLTIHASLGFVSLYQRRQLRMRPVESVQLVLGFLIPLLLASHVIGTRVLDEVFGISSDYTTVVLALWYFKPDFGLLQAITVVVVWVHAMIGMHMWLRLKTGYNRYKPWLLGLAVALPVASLAGYVSAGIEILELTRVDGWVDAVLSSYGMTSDMPKFVLETNDYVQAAVLVVLAAIMAARAMRHYLNSRKRRRITLTYAPGGTAYALEPGASVLETLLSAGVDHASVCGGRGRCSTCRVRIEEGNEHLPSPDDQEQKVLDRTGLKGPVRLACQIKPAQDLSVVALIPPEATTQQTLMRRDHR